MIAGCVFVIPIALWRRFPPIASIKQSNQEFFDINAKDNLKLRSVSLKLVSRRVEKSFSHESVANGSANFENAGNNQFKRQTILFANDNQSICLLDNTCPIVIAVDCVFFGEFSWCCRGDQCILFDLYSRNGICNIFGILDETFNCSINNPTNPANSRWFFRRIQAILHKNRIISSQYRSLLQNICVFFCIRCC